MDEPLLRVGLREGVREIGLELDGAFAFESAVEGGSGAKACTLQSEGLRLRAAGHAGRVEVRDAHGSPFASAARVRFSPDPGAPSRFLLRGVPVGARFHWEHAEDLAFEGALLLEAAGEGLLAVNEVPLERYLVSVISSEMSASCPPELLRAHAVISRSWLLAQISPHAPANGAPTSAPAPGAGPAPGADDVEEIASVKGVPVLRIRRWYDREQHTRFDVCADDHCQRYHGITRAASPEVERAVTATRGLALVHAGEVCDARFSKCCGGMTELFSSAWGDTDFAYLQAFPDAPAGTRPFALQLGDAARAAAFIDSRPAVYCNVTDRDLLLTILPAIDQATSDFFRWKTSLTQGELRHFVFEKTGIEPGPVRALRALRRGPSGRIVELEISGERAVLHVGKELEVRRLLSATHLYSSAFRVDPAPAGAPVPERFTLRGAGWGHGVGLCQIGAAGMAAAGRDHREILSHYYPGADLRRQY